MERERVAGPHTENIQLSEGNKFSFVLVRRSRVAIDPPSMKRIREISPSPFHFICHRENKFSF